MRAYVRICLDMSHGWRLNTARVRAGQGRQNSLDRNWHQRLQREHIAQHCETDSEIVESMFEIMQCLKMKYIVRFKLETVLIDNLTSPIQRKRLKSLASRVSIQATPQEYFLSNERIASLFGCLPKGLSPQLTWSPSRRSLPKIENRHHLFSTRERREEWALVRSSLTMKFNSNPSGNGLACMIQVSIEDCRTFPFFMLSLKYPRFGRYVLMLIITCTK